MPEKLTLAVYLERRGAVKTLTKIEAEAFGIPYPLVKGWPYKFGAVEITQGMLEQLQEKIGRAKSSTAEKAQRGLDGVEGLPVALTSTVREVVRSPPVVAPPAERVSAIAGFVLRQARRYKLLGRRRKLKHQPKF